MSTSSIALVLVSSIAPITSNTASDADQQVTQLNQRISHLNDKLSQLSAPAAGGDDSPSETQIQEQKQIIQAQLVALQSQVAILQQGEPVPPAATAENASESVNAPDAASGNNRLDLYI
ncbi:FlxA-like family protein [Brenneria populi]|uniref:FlxA-like family protein n=1 Tax=Brenneria populi TaxID=1505588 RepID=A0ABU6JVB5_9GAMM|nr:FlxA-like family protein [Brenneria populi Li et al. 2015]